MGGFSPFASISHCGDIVLLALLKSHPCEKEDFLESVSVFRLHFVFYYIDSPWNIFMISYVSTHMYPSSLTFFSFAIIVVSFWK